MALLEVDGLYRSFGGGSAWSRRRRGITYAVEDVSFRLDAGETLAIVGESGAGKSTVARMVLRLLEPERGAIVLDGADISHWRSRALRRIRPKVQLIFQDPYSSLDPTKTIHYSMAEAFVVNGRAKAVDIDAEVLALLERVGLDRHHGSRFPYELSGGQLQRVSIARSLVSRPSIIVCDEPVSALDVSIRAQILNLLTEIQQDTQVAYLFISHDLGLVRAFADRVAVMRSGRIVEQGNTEAIFAGPADPYTQELLDAVPVADPRQRSLLD